MRWFVSEVPTVHRNLDAYITMNVKLLLHDGSFEEAATILGKECFPTYAKARNDLMTMWNSAQEGTVYRI